MSDWYGIAAVVITGVGFVCGVGYAIDYTRLSFRARRLGYRGWWQSELGWVLWGFPTALTAILGFVLFSRIFGDSIVRQIIGLVLWTIVMAMIPWKWRIMRKSQAKVVKVVEMISKEEFVRRVMELVETDRLGELDRLYDELVNGGNNYPEITTHGGETATVRWGTP